MMDSAPLSAVVITKNEAGRIGACLENLRWAGEVVIVDDESTDGTAELCRQRGATVIVRASGGDFDGQRNAGIDAARHEWILQMDADETVPEPLREEILRALRQPGEAVAFRIRRLNVFLGRPMRHGGWGWRGVKLFKRSAGRYVGHSVHETLKVTGSVGELRSPVRHEPFQSIAQFMERQNFYSDVEARLQREDGRAVSDRDLRYQLLRRPVKLFWKSYVKQTGWREGIHGLIFAALFAWVHFLKWAKVWAMGLPAGPVAAHPGRPPRPASGEGLSEVSVVVLTKNEESRIARCLESVRWAGEILLIDGGSTDRTAEIARAFGATVVTHPFDGSFATDRNLGLQHARGEWVLQIDADDVATPEFRDAIQAMVRSRPAHAAFKFRRQSVLLGRVMRHGGWHYSVPNLLRRTRARYEGLVHERPVIDGTLGELAADIEHHSCTDLSAFVARQNRYTALQAEELFRVMGPLPERRIQRLLWKKPWKTFWKSYVKKAGWREGIHGLVFAEFYAGVELLKWAKYWERCRRDTNLQ